MINFISYVMFKRVSIRFAENVTIFSNNDMMHKTLKRIDLSLEKKVEVSTQMKLMLNLDHDDFINVFHFTLLRYI